jgi:PBP1b-binding outer membrane lipoprotein LpoB
MKKRIIMAMVIAIALGIACTYHSVQQEKAKQQQPVKKVSVPYAPSAFIDVALFPGNVFQFLVNSL